MTVVVVGQVAREGVLRVVVPPDTDGSTPVEELLGGEGTDQVDVLRA